MGTIRLGKKNTNKRILAKNIKEQDEKVLEEITRTAFSEEVKDGELFERRTKNSMTFKKKDGSLSKIISAVPHFYANDGKMKEISTKLIDIGDEIVNETNAFNVRFHKGDADNSIFSLANKGKNLVLRSGIKGKESKSVSAGCVRCADNENMVSVELDNGDSINYSVLNDRVKEDIVIKEKRDSYEYSFTLDFDGLTVEEGKKNELLLRGEDDKIYFIIPAPVMYDEAGVRSDDVYYEVEQENDSLNIKVVASGEFINDGARVFPVIIDPQIVIAESLTSVFEYYTETYDTGYSENDYSYNIMIAQNKYTQDFNEQIFLTVDLTEAKQSGDILSAKVRLMPKNGAKGKVRVSIQNDGGASTIYTAPTSTFDINIPDNIIASSNSVVICISAYTTSSVEESYVEFFTDGDNSPKLILEYAADYVEPETRLISLAGGATGTLYLADGILVVNFNDKVGDFVVPFEFYHSYSSDEKVWCLSSERSLIQSGNGDISEKTNLTHYVYKDENGCKHNFYEKYFYFNSSGSIVEVDKDQVTVSLDGELSYNGYKVLSSFICPEGYTLSGEYSTFKGSKFIEQRYDEQIELEESIKSYKEAIEEFKICDRNNDILYNGLWLTEDIEADEQAYDNFLASITVDKRLLTLNAYSQYISLKESRNSSGLSTTEKELINAQMNAILNAADENEGRLESYFRTYLSKLNELKRLNRQIPVTFIKDNNGITSGFNSDGKLVAMYDGYENNIVFEYSDDGLLTSVYDSDGKELSMQYDASKRLVSISDGRGRRTEYAYSSNNISTVTFSDGSTLSFTYSNSSIYRITSSFKQQSTLNYTSGKLTNVVTDAQYTSFDKDSTTLGTKVISKVDVTYSGQKTTVISDSYDVCEYTFSLAGRLTEYVHKEHGCPLETVVYDYDMFDHDNVTRTEAGNSNTIVENRTLNLLNKPSESESGWEYIDTDTQVKNTTNYFYDREARLIRAETEKQIKKGTVLTTENSVVKYKYNAAGGLVRTESYVVGEELTSGINIEETEYDEKGNPVRTISWNSLDSSSKFYVESEYAEDGAVLSDYDELGTSKTEYRYIPDTSVVREKVMPDGVRIGYGRDADTDELTSVSFTTSDGEANSVDIARKYGLAVEVKSGSTNLAYGYDHKGRVKSLSINGTDYATWSHIDYSYDQSNEEASISGYTVTYADGNTAKREESGSLDEDTGWLELYTKTYYNNQLQYEKKLNGDRNTERVRLYTNGAVSQTEQYEYDALKRIKTVTRTKSGQSGTAYTENYSYNNDGKISQLVQSGDVSRTTAYSYKTDAARTLESVTVGGIKYCPLTDVNGRNTGKEVYSGANKFAGEYITYRKNGDHASAMPASVYFGGKIGDKFVISENFKYRYDKCGNITEVLKNGALLARYGYDGAGRLVREDNKNLGTTTTYAYDNSGNILFKHIYTFTVQELGEADSEIAYAYDGDRLISYNGESCAYNVLGNPTTYRGEELTWHRGKLLSKYGTTTFTYDGAGKRTGKGSITFTYDSEGRLIKQSNGLEFFYAGSGLAGVKYSGATYIYRRDAQGNIVALIDTNGAKVAEYVYDAWGNHAVVDSSGNDIESGIGALNPFRYRGYYYDTETGLYYLKTRYYDPEVGRFISRDSVSYADPETINGLNLYAYCGNNPVMNIDPQGHFWFTALTTIFGAIVGTVVGVVDYVVNNDGEFDGGEMFKSAIAGGASGATAGFILGITKGTGLKAASYASAAVYSATKEVWDYADGSKELNAANVGNSILQVIGDTAVNGTLNYVANTFAAKMVPANPGWFIPKKFFSYFTKPYGQKMMAQTFIGGSISNITNILWGGIKRFKLRYEAKK